jgi:hypothetical protein
MSIVLETRWFFYRCFVTSITTYRELFIVDVRHHSVTRGKGFVERFYFLDWLDNCAFSTSVGSTITTRVFGRIIPW